MTGPRNNTEGPVAISGSGECANQGFDMTSVEWPKDGAENPRMRLIADMCAGCAIRTECLDLGLADSGENTVYGGYLFKPFSGGKLDVRKVINVATGEELTRGELRDRRQNE